MSNILTKRRISDGLVVLVIIAIVAYWFTSPYFAVRSLRAAIVNADEQTLGEIVDFPVLRQNLKDQFTSQMDRWAVEHEESMPALAASALGGIFVDRLIDAYVTPSGVVRLASKVEIPDDADVPFTALFDSVGSVFLDQGDYAIDRGLRSFSLRIQTMGESEDEIEVIFEGNGLKWILVNVILPLDSSE